MKNSTTLLSVSAVLAAALFLGPAHSSQFLAEPRELFNEMKEASHSSGAITLVESNISARKDGRKLLLSFPLSNRTGEDQRVSYLVTLRDLQGNKIADRDGRKTIGPGSTNLSVRLRGYDLNRQSDEEIEYVVSYTVKAGRKGYRGSRSLFYMLPKPVLAASVPERFFAGGKGRIPIVLTDAVTRTPYSGEKVTIVAETDDGHTREHHATTDEQGTALIELSGLKKGLVKVRVASEVDGASPTEVNGTVDVVEDTKIFLSTDKPLYQPGQTMHVRALVLSRPDMVPAGRQDALVEIFDSKGNKVFKKVSRTNRFGVVSARFTLANQVNRGAYNIMMTVGDNQTDKAVTVDRYVLPKFKVNVQLDRDFYLPSQKVEGTVQAAYFFGKPVADANVKITVFDYQAQWVPDRVIEGTANEEGILHFSYKLPSRLIGQPVEGGNALMLVEIEVEDGGGQQQKEARQLVVARTPLEINVFPESGAVVAGVENDFFVTLTDPAGHPAAGSCKLSFNESGKKRKTIRVKVDRSGLTRVSYTPAAHTGALDLQARAESDTGGRVDKSFRFDAARTDARVLVRTDKSLLKVGDSLVLDVITAGAVSDAYVDVTKENQTIAVATVELDDGIGRHRLDIDPSMAGTLAVSAYVLSERGEYTRDTRVVFVESASDLDIDVKLDADQYKPGEKATIDFKVTGKGGQPVQAAMGIHIVDEAVFALSESKPGLLKLFFALEEELLKPSYQIGRGTGLTLGSLIIHARDAEAKEAERYQDNAEAAIAAQGDAAVAKQALSSWSDQRTRVRGRLDGYSAWVKQEFISAVKKKNCNGGWYQFGDEIERAVDELEQDAWGRAFNIETGPNRVELWSSGPDRKLDTWDDVRTEIYPGEVCPYLARRKFRGGGGGGWLDGEAGGPVPMAAAAEMGMRADVGKLEEKKFERETTVDEDRGGQEGEGGGEEVRVRTWFPETLFVENCLITDEEGNATLEVPLADSITTWRMSTIASDMGGHIGGTATPVTVFQDFFVDIDFPVFLTRNDTIEFPVVVYNYLEEEQNVDIEVKGGDWFEMLGGSDASLRLKPGQVASVRFPVRVRKVGWHSLTVFGRGSAGFADAVQRTVQVRPDGEEILTTAGGKFKTVPDDVSKDSVELEFAYPRSTIEGSQQVVVQILPGLTSHVVQGMDSMLKLPGG